MEFHTKFASQILTGKKTQTIRRAAPTKPPQLPVGKVVDFYVNRNKRNERKIAQAEITESYKLRWDYAEGKLYLDDRLLSEDELEQIAKLDGFGNFTRMRTWFVEKYGAWEGEKFFYLYRWELLDTYA